MARVSDGYMSKMLEKNQQENEAQRLGRMIKYLRLTTGMKRGMQLEKEQIQLFEEHRIRTAWDEESEEWYFSIVDVVGVLTECKDYNAARNYRKVTKHRMRANAFSMN